MTCDVKSVVKPKSTTTTTTTTTTTKGRAMITTLNGFIWWDRNITRRKKES